MSINNDWKPSVPLENLKLRAKTLAKIREFFSARDVMEVDTPILAPYTVTSVHIESLQTTVKGPGGERSLFLQTSPEYYMKRLLAAGSGDIYQIATVFRDGELGKYHQPEFTMLEWYRLGFDHHALMDEIESLMIELFPIQSTERISYRDLFLKHCDIDPLSANVFELIARAEQHNVAKITGLESADRDTWLDILMTHVIESTLGEEQPVFVYDYPASQASLSRLNENHQTAARFELYYKGVELANGFFELSDPSEQRQRFIEDNVKRQEQKLPTIALDENLLAALEHGMPSCAGVAIGIDRLLMLLCDCESIAEVICTS